MKTTDPQVIVTERNDGDFDVLCAFPEGINPEVKLAVLAVIELHYYGAQIKTQSIVSSDVLDKEAFEEA